MKIPILQGLDLSQSNKNNLSPSSGSDAPTAPLRSRSKKFFRSRTKKNVEMVSDDVLDSDLTSTPSVHVRTPSMNKRNFFEIDNNNNSRNSNKGDDVEMMSERRRSLFEPLGPHDSRSFESLLALPPPDFDESSYPQGWSIGKKRKLVNVDVVESMRRIAVQEMNRKDREINGLNEQLEEDSKTMEHLQLELQQERQKRLQAERENSVLQGRVEMLMTMLNELEEDVEAEHMDDSQVINM